MYNMWTLVIMMHVGVMGAGNSNALTNVDGFKSKQTCEAAGSLVKPMTNGTVKEIVTVCVEVK